MKNDFWDLSTVCVKIYTLDYIHRAVSISHMNLTMADTISARANLFLSSWMICLLKPFHASR